jgi:hypothetical protein
MTSTRPNRPGQARIRLANGFFVTRCADFFGKSLGVCQRSLDEYARPPEVARRLFYRLLHRENFPHGNAMAGQVRFAA